MNHKTYAAIVALLLIGALAAPNSAFAQPVPRQYVQCAIGWNGPENIVLTIGTTQSATGVRDAGAMCTHFIQSGLFRGQDKYRSMYGFRLLCQIDMGFNESIDVYVGDDPSYRGEYIAYTICQGMADEGWPVGYQ